MKNTFNMDEQKNEVGKLQSERTQLDVQLRELRSVKWERGGSGEGEGRERVVGKPNSPLVNSFVLPYSLLN